jgi:DNA-binding MarR family transcriptional regulator
VPTTGERGDGGPPGEGDLKLDILPSLSSSGPLSSSARVAILAALLAFRRTTFTELMLVVNVPKSSLNMSLTILKESGYITVRKGFMGMGGPRTIVETTSAGEKAIREHLALMQNLAQTLLQQNEEDERTKGS